MAFFAGREGSITVGATTLALSEWSLDIKTDPVDTTNFTDGGYQSNLAGITAAEISASGPYNRGGVGLTSGATASFTLTVGTGASFVVTARITQLGVNTNVKDKANFKLSASSTGTFTSIIS